jgi:signal transduction histidine kinase
VPAILEKELPMSAADEVPSSLSANPLPGPELRSRQEHLETASVVAGRLAHDFGNILTGILGFAELAQLRLPADAASQRYLSGVLRSGEQAKQLLSRLSLFGRCLSSPGQSSHLAPVLSGEADRLRSLWGPSVRLQWSLPGDLPALALPPEHLRQVLVELCDNAREAIATEGLVTVGARRVELLASACWDLLGNPQPGAHVEVTVSDTGSGLDPRLRERLFREPLVSTKSGHRGLGLAIVFGILRAHRGGFRVGPGDPSGTTVRLFLPIAAATLPVSPDGVG